jgi:hypothetical protein
MSALIDAALKLLQSGKPVFPVNRLDKKPYVQWKEFQSRLPSPEQVRTWWKLWPQASIGMATGRLSGLLIVDTDSAESTRRFETEFPEACATLQAGTSRGKHSYFTFEDGIRNDAGLVLGPGIDIRGEGGFVIVPPSVHARGTVYKWLNKNKPSHLPETLRIRLLVKSEERKMPAPAVNGRIPDHQRNVTLTSFAGSMHRRGMSEASILVALLEENGNRCDPPLDEDEVARIANSVARYPAQEEIEKFDSAPRTESVRNGISPQTWGEFINTDFGGLPYTVRDILMDQGLAVIHGRGKQQKSTLVIHLLRAIATGRPFLEKETTRKGVLYLNYEMGFDYLQKLLRAGGDPPPNALVLNRPEPVLQLETVDKLFTDLIPGGVMVIDSFRGAFRLQGDAENSAGGAGRILRHLQDIALKHKGLIIVIHHRNRNQGRDGTDAISGTSDWIAAPDVIWSWSRSDKAKPGTLIIEGRIPPVDPLAVSLSPEECRFEGNVQESREKTDQEAILKSLTQEGQTADAIAPAANLGPGTVRKRLEAMFEEGLVNREGGGVKGDPFLWSKIIPHAARGYRAETNSEGWEEIG